MAVVQMPAQCPRHTFSQATQQGHTSRTSERIQRRREGSLFLLLLIVAAATSANAAGAPAASLQLNLEAPLALPFGLHVQARCAELDQASSVLGMYSSLTELVDGLGPALALSPSVANSTITALKSGLKHGSWGRPQRQAAAGGVAQGATRPQALEKWVPQGTGATSLQAAGESRSSRVGSRAPQGSGTREMDLPRVVTRRQLRVRSTGGSVRRQLELQVDLPPASIPDVNFTSTNGSLVILASNRTRRPNPMNHFQLYTGGWDFFNSSYWASLTWTTVYGAGIGIVWALFGLGFVVVLLLTCICCRHRWHNLRDPTKRYEKSQLTLPMLFMLFGVILECVGLGLMVAGAVKFTGTAHGLTNFTVTEVTRVAHVVTNVTPILRKLVDSQGPLNDTISPDVRTKVLEISDQAEQVATSALSTAQVAGDSVDQVLEVLQDVLFCLGIITVGIVFIGLVFTCCRLVCLSNTMTTIIWIACLCTWVLVTVFLFVWLFGGDTSVALGQIAVTPTDLTKFNLLVPCLNPVALDALALFVRFTGYQSIFIVNATIAQEAPFIFSLLQTPSGICNPFGPAPNYTYSPDACNGICDPYAKYCNGSAIDLGTLVSRYPMLKCNSTNTLKCIVVNSITSEVQVIANAAQEIVFALEKLIPLLFKILKCAYITVLAQELSSQIKELEYDTLLLWLGFMFVSVGAIFYAVCAPIYVYRAVRCSGKEGPQSELTPIKDAASYDTSSTSHLYTDSARNQAQESEGAQWGAAPAQQSFHSPHHDPQWGAAPAQQSFHSPHHDPQWGAAPAQQSFHSPHHDPQ